MEEAPPVPAAYDEDEEVEQAKSHEHCFKAPTKVVIQRPMHEATTRPIYPEEITDNNNYVQPPTSTIVQKTVSIGEDSYLGQILPTSVVNK